jgi:hypothetical protein
MLSHNPASFFNCKTRLNRFPVASNPFNGLIAGEKAFIVSHLLGKSPGFIIGVARAS